MRYEDRGGWVKIEKLEKLTEGFRIKKDSAWSGPGWYWVKTYEQRCPRG